MEEGFHGRDTALKAAADQDGDLDFGDVQPAPVLGSVVLFEALREAASLLGREGLVREAVLVSVEVVLHQHDACGVWMDDFGEVAEDQGIVLGRCVCLRGPRRLRVCPPAAWRA